MDHRSIIEKINTHKKQPNLRFRLKRNTEKDRPEQDWTLQTKRAVI